MTSFPFDSQACVVTGVAGFVGSHLAERLLALGYKVVGVDNFFSGNLRNMASFSNHPSFTFYERSITESALLLELKERHPDLTCCFHLAAIVSVPHSLEYPEETMAVNYRSTLALLNQSDELGFSRFVFAGSAAEYGNDQRLPLREEYASDSTNHLSPYGYSKYLASKEVASRLHGRALRCFNIYGPRQDPKSPYSGVISRFMDMAMTKKPLTVFGDGQQTRDFIFVSDIVEAYLAASSIEREASNAETGVYNVGSGESCSVLELAEIVRKLTDNHTSRTFLPERSGDIRHSLASIEAFGRATSWSPRVSLREGLRITMDSMTADALFNGF